MVGVDTDLWVIGGGFIYEQALNMLLPDELHVSRMNCYVFGSKVTDKDNGQLTENNTMFPEIPNQYALVSTEPYEDHSYLVYKRSFDEAP